MKLCYQYVGSSCIEVLVSLVILGIAVIGVVAMQIKSVTVVTDAYYRTQAIAVAQDVIERIKANPRGWPDLYAGQEWRGSDSISQLPCAGIDIPLDVSAGCDQENEVVKYDHFEVSHFLLVSLPNSIVRILEQCPGGRLFSCVEVSWGDGMFIRN